MKLQSFKDAITNLKRYINARNNLRQRLSKMADQLSQLTQSTKVLIRKKGGEEIDPIEQ